MMRGTLSGASALGGSISASGGLGGTLTTGVADNSITTAKLADGAVTDAKLVQTDGALSGHLARVNDRIPMKVVKNSYVNNAGSILAYNGWDRTDYMNVRGLNTIKVTAPSASNYNVFYDATKTKIGAAGIVISIAGGENIVEVPSNAVYAIFSGTASYIAGLTVSAVKSEDEKDIERQIDLVQTDLLGKQNLVFDLADFTVGAGIDSSGNPTTNNSVASTSGYWPLVNTQNAYEFECVGYQVRIAEYAKKQDGTFSFVKISSGFIANGGTLWCATGTTHIRVVFKTNANNNMTETFVRDFCDVFAMRESRDTNKYIRVCSFNMARDYASLEGADPAGIQRQIRNYLNFIGQYDPDVIQAQEAGGAYWDSGNTQPMNSTVFDRKYLFPQWVAYNLKTWSKYNTSEPTSTTFSTNYSGDTRVYTKMFLHFEGKTICLLNAHCAYQGTFEECRKLQFQELAAEMAQHEYCILCGDFNAYDVSEFDEFSAFNMANCGEYGDLDTWLLGSDYPSWPNKCIDNIITTTNIKIQNVQVGPYDFDYFSDHAPLIADLQIR